jgi:Putative restriction endonuclease
VAVDLLIDHLSNRSVRILKTKAQSIVATISTQSNVLGCENGIPTLEAGDRLTRFEFERRYSAMPEVEKAELLEGALLEPAKGGQSRIAPDDDVEGAPEFVGEIASSSVSYDLDVKLKVYRRSNVREYIVWRVLDRQIDWFSTQRGRVCSDASR